jgi:hypothetical protein
MGLSAAKPESSFDDCLDCGIAREVGHDEESPENHNFLDIYPAGHYDWLNGDEGLAENDFWIEREDARMPVWARGNIESSILIVFNHGRPVGSTASSIGEG